MIACSHKEFFRYKENMPGEYMNVTVDSHKGLKFRYEQQVQIKENFEIFQMLELENGVHYCVSFVKMIKMHIR